MKLLAKQNRELIMINPQNTQNENDTEKITLQVPEQYEDFNKKIVFVTPDGNVWDIITNNEYLIKKAITKYKQVDFYIWLTKGDVDFRTKTKTLKFYDNVDASNEITDEEIGRVNTVINLLEEEITKVENLESQVDGKLEEIDTAISDIHTAIQETENLNLDAEKVGQTTTVTLTKKDGTTKVVHVDDGVDLQFTWQGTSLGIKTAEQEQYTFVDLQGVQGQRGEQGEPFAIKKTYSSVTEMNADFNNMQLGDYVMIASTVEVEDNAKLYTRGESAWIFITDFSGATGIRGETGLTPNIQIGTVTQGTSFNVTRTGTNENPVLNFTLVKGDKGDRGIQGIQGLTGNGISSIRKTGTDGLVDTYTITYTNGNTTTFTITNGEDGEVTETELNVLREKVANQQKVIDQLPQVTGQGTSITLENTIEAPFTKFDVEGNSVQDGTPSPDNEQPIKSAGDDENLFDGETITFNAYDNIETAKDGLVTTKALSNTGTSNVNIRFPALNLSPDTYYISMDIRIKSGTGNFVKLNDGATDWSVVSKPTISSSFQRYVYKHTYTAEKALNQILVQFSNNSNTVYEIKRIMVSNKATPWSPYGMGSITEKIVNGNLFNKNNYEGIFAGNQSNGILNKDDTRNQWAIMKCPENINISTYVQGIDTNHQSLGIIACLSKFPVAGASVLKVSSYPDYRRITTPKGTKYIMIWLGGTYQNNWTSIEEKVDSLIVANTTEIINEEDYVPHQEQTYSIYTQQPMRSIGDVRDKFNEDNKTEDHYITRKIFDGTEQWTKISTRFFIEMADIILNGVTESLCNYFKKAENWAEHTNTNNSIIIYKDNAWSKGRLSINTDKFETINEFNAWLSSENVYIDYPSQEPTNLPCTEEQIQQLENKPSTYKDFTIIQSEDETPAYLEVSGIYDLNKLINN